MLMRPYTVCILLAVVCGTLFFWRLGSVPLIGLDEGLYAECSREMAISGNWVVPTYNGRPFCDKPPLAYWLQAAAMHVFGPTSLAARLPSAVCATLLVALIACVGSRIYGQRAGLTTGFMLAASPLAAGLARLALLDQLFTLTISISLGAYLMAHLSAWPRWTYLVFWAAAGLAVMAKGPAAIVVVAAAIGVFLLATRQMKSFGRSMPLVGVAVFCAVTVPWYLAANSQTGGVFLKEFLIHQNIQRATGKDFHHNLPLLFYVPVFVAGFFPWSLFVPAAWRRLVKGGPTDESGQASLFFAIWAAVVVGVFSLSTSKLPSYILPAIPAAALLVGAYWARAIEEDKAQTLMPPVVAALLVAGPFGAALLFGQTLLPRPIPGLENALIPMGLALLAGSGLAVLMTARRRAVLAFASLGAGSCAFLLVAIGIGLPVAARSLAQPAARVGAEVREAASAGSCVVVYNLSPPQPAMVFYAQRPLEEAKDAEGVSKHVRKCRLVVAQQGRTHGIPVGGRLLMRSGPYLLYEFRDRTQEFSQARGR